MKKYSLILPLALAIFVLFFAGSRQNVAEAADCCPAVGNCTITASPCELNGTYNNSGSSFGINVDTADPVKIILTGNTSLRYYPFNLENQFVSANKSLIILGAVPPGLSRNGYDFSISTSGPPNALTFPSGGLEIDLSVPPASTGNGGTLLIDVNGTMSILDGAEFKVFTYAGNAAGLSGASEPKGGSVTFNVNANLNLGTSSLIQTGATAGNLTNGGDINIQNNGSLTSGPLNFLSSSSSDKAGNITVSSNGHMRIGAHANGGNQGGIIDLSGNGNYYSPSCSGDPAAIEAKNNGSITLGVFNNLIDLASNTTTGGGNLTVKSSNLSDCSCLPTGGACWNQLTISNSTVNITAVACIETDPLTACPPGSAVSDVSSTNGNDFYKAGAIINITVKFAGSVTVTGSPTLELETGAVNRAATYSSGSGTDTLNFQYTVQAGDNSDDLDYVATNSLSLNGGTIKDSATAKSANLTLPLPGNIGSLGNNKEIVIDTQAPAAPATAYDKDGNSIADGADIGMASATTVKILSTALDNPPPVTTGVFANRTSWTRDNWTNTNTVDCGNSTNCWIRIDSVPISFSTDSTNGTDGTWTSCGSAGSPHAACIGVTDWAGPLGAGRINYKASALDLAQNETSTEKFFNIINNPPAINPNPNYDPPFNYCSAPYYTFKWTFNDPGDTESQYQIQIDNNSDFSSPTVDRTFSGLSNPDGTINQQQAILGMASDAPCAPAPCANPLAYGTTYYWQIQVWDSAGASSGWQSGASFTTEPHAWPTVAFSPPPPSNFIVNTPINFRADSGNSPYNSICYGAGNSIVACSNWSWDFCRGAACTNKNISGESVSHTYDLAGTYDVALTVSDGTNSCTNAAGTKVLGTLKPKWKEVTPR